MPTRFKLNTQQRKELNDLLDKYYFAGESGDALEIEPLIVKFIEKIVNNNAV